MGCPLIAGKTQDEEREICLNCPLPQCIFDSGAKNPFLQDRDIQIISLASQGKTVAQLAEMFNLSQRTIQRTLNLELRT